MLHQTHFYVRLHTCAEVVPSCVVRCPWPLTYFSLGVASLLLPIIRAPDGWWRCCSRERAQGNTIFYCFPMLSHKVFPLDPRLLHRQCDTHTQTHIHWSLHSCKDTKTLLLWLIPVPVCLCFIPWDDIHLPYLSCVHMHVCTHARTHTHTHKHSLRCEQIGWDVDECKTTRGRKWKKKTPEESLILDMLTLI